MLDVADRGPNIENCFICTSESLGIMVNPLGVDQNIVRNRYKTLGKGAEFVASYAFPYFENIDGCVCVNTHLALVLLRKSERSIVSENLHTSWSPKILEPETLDSV